MTNFITVWVSAALGFSLGTLVYLGLKRIVARRKPVPPGSYKTVVDTVVEQDGKVRLSMRIVEGPYKGRKLYG